MKKVLSVLLACIIFFGATTHAKSRSIRDDKKGFSMLEGAIKLYDDGDYEEALVEFDKLRKKFPKDYLVNYERGLTLYSLGRYKDVVTEMKKLRKHPESTALVYQLWGNATDMLGKPNDAIKIYGEGIEKFPDAGCLFLEIGNVYMANDLKEEACRMYNLGIEVDPNFASNYYRGAKYYFETDTAAWGLIYAETEILLKPNDETRLVEMAQGMLDCYRTRVVQNGGYPEVMPQEGDSIKLIHVRLAPATNIIINKPENGVEESEGVIDVAGVIELLYMKALSRFLYERERFDPMSFESLTKLRRYMVEAYFEMTDNYFGNGLYLLEFQKRIIDAGHWEAYNYILFSDVLPYYCELWNDANPGTVKAFIDWYNQDIFTLGDGKTVGKLSSMRYVKPMGIRDLFSFVYKLQTPYGSKKIDTDDEE